MIDVSKYVKTLERRPVAVFGLGASGLSAVKALVKAGANVVAWDDKAQTHKDGKEAGAKIKLINEENIGDFAALVLGPGVPLHGDNPHEVTVAAQNAGVEIIGDIEVLHRCKHGRKTIGITGTNGKSTTTALVSHVLESCGIDNVMGGNIGKPVLDTRLPKKDGYFVQELSSFQLDLCPTFAPDIAVLLNITADHIDRHGSMEGYATTKERIFRNAEGAAVISIDDDYCRDIYERLKKIEDKKVVPLTVGREIEGGVYVEEGVLYDSTGGEAQEVGSLNSVSTLNGSHNHQNAGAAYAVARLCGLEPAAILEAIKSYPGLPHRQYPVRKINGVAYINDSKATNAEAAGKALACHNNIYWIVGGKPKDGGLNGLEQYVSNIKHAFLIGEAAEDFAGWLDKHQVPHQLAKTIDVAVQQAHVMAQGDRGQPGGGGVVLLSPAAASYDQFKSFEDRGNQFTELVKALDDGDMAP